MRTFLLLTLSVVVPAGGCGTGPATRVAQTEPGRGTVAAVPGGGREGLTMLGDIYRGFQDARGRPPKAYGELAAYALDLSRPLPPGIMAFDVVWGAGMGPMCRDGDASAVVIASAPAVAGTVPVLMADGTTRTMAPEEYRGAKRATPPVP